MNCIFMYNPVSGKGKIGKKLDFIVKELKEKYDEVNVFATKKAGDMREMASLAIGRYDAIVFAGGDGSFNEVLQGIADKENLPELGYIPTGTANDIAHTLKIPKNVKKALKIVKTGRNEMLDCMKVNDGYAMYVVAAGAFTSATYETPQASKNQIGKIAYFVEGAKNNLNLEVFDVAFDGDSHVNREESVFISFMNSRYVAGFKVNRLASLQDGKIEGAVIRRKKNCNFFQKLGALLSVAKMFVFGWRAKDKQTTCFECAHFVVDVPDDVVWNFDGEKGVCGKIKISVVPKKINMIVPQKLKKV